MKLYILCNTDLVKGGSNVAFNYIHTDRITNVLYIEYCNLLLYEVIDTVSESNVVQFTVVFCYPLECIAMNINIAYLSHRVWLCLAISPCCSGGGGARSDD